MTAERISFSIAPTLWANGSSGVASDAMQEMLANTSGVASNATQGLMTKTFLHGTSKQACMYMRDSVSVSARSSISNPESSPMNSEGAEMDSIVQCRSSQKERFGADEVSHLRGLLVFHLVDRQFDDWGDGFVCKPNWQVDDVQHDLGGHTFPINIGDPSLNAEQEHTSTEGSGKLRPCKGNQKRYRQLLVKLLGEATAHPHMFDFEALQLPPSIAVSSTAKDKLARTLKFASVVMK